jgi:nanoRNase/pAp phosphatase (c-di-AMP/oligoRNAs hydrolase)
LRRNSKIERAYLLRLDRVLRRSTKILITSHDNPDPDAIASALVLKKLITSRYRARVTLGYGGVIGRAENSALVEFAQADFRPHSRMRIGSFDTIALVDTQPGTGNHPFTSEDNVRLVLDHHRMRPETRGVEFHDVRTHIGATATIVHQYAQAWGIRLTKRHATILTYALRTETADLGVKASEADLEAYRTLYPLTDLRALAAIGNPKVGRDYFAAVHDGIENTRVYDAIVITRLGELAYPDIVAQTADYFLKYREASHSFAIGRYRNALLFSIRSDHPRARMGRIARELVVGLGTAGGHGSTAGGQVDVAGLDRFTVRGLQDRIILRFLRAMGQSRQRGTKLVKRPRRSL